MLMLLSVGYLDMMWGKVHDGHALYLFFSNRAGGKRQTSARNLYLVQCKWRGSLIQQRIRA